MSLFVGEGIKYDNIRLVTRHPTAKVNGFRVGFSAQSRRSKGCRAVIYCATDSLSLGRVRHNNV